MSNRTTYGGRLPRLLDESGEGWYHVYNRVACEKSQFPLSTIPDARETFLRFLDFYSNIYCCEIATYAIMGNHYHIILRMQPYRQFSEEERQIKVETLYPNTYKQANAWSDEYWEQFNQRMFSLSELMRNIQQGYARWFNKNHNRRGRFWADRFKSTILYGEESLIECMQYVDLNPVRAGLVERPEDYAQGAFALRYKNEADALLPLHSVTNERYEVDAFEIYRSQVYLRGDVPSKDGEASLSSDIIDRELANDFKLNYEQRNNGSLRRFTDGLVLGTQKHIENWVNKLDKWGFYKRRKKPNEISPTLFALRSQRKHFEGDSTS
ncbi:MAG: hypothetical protein HQL32_01915 [Planctomycetes bacterium]|nr:hypothetical protein [Planctomycetota bacterium]